MSVCVCVFVCVCVRARACAVDKLSRPIIYFRSKFDRWRLRSKIGANRPMT